MFTRAPVLAASFALAGVCHEVQIAVVDPRGSGKRTVTSVGPRSQLTPSDREPIGVPGCPSRRRSRREPSRARRRDAAATA